MTKKGQETMFGLLATMESYGSLGEEQMVVYAEATIGFPDELVVKAVRYIMVTEDKRPSVSRLLSEIIQAADPAPTTTKAVVELRNQRIPSATTHGAVKHASEEMGGIRAIGRMDEKDFDSKFASAYKKGIEEWLRAEKKAIVDGTSRFVQARPETGYTQRTGVTARVPTERRRIESAR